MGLMSGTSADGVDAALLRIDKNGIKDFGPYFYRPYSKNLRSRILAAMGVEKGEPSPELIHLITVEHYKAVRALMRKSKVQPVLIGMHGQTLYHKPKPSRSGKAQTLQVAHAANMAYWLNIPVVHQFRLADIEAGGEGAPLAPVFHQALLGSHLTNSEMPSYAFVNIGGVCNITTFSQNGGLFAGDVGPGCALLDDWLYNNIPNGSYSDLSDLAFKGEPDLNMIQAWLTSAKFFQVNLPKSADRMQWKKFLKDIAGYKPEDAVATLFELTIACLKGSLPSYIDTLCLAGGGRHHQYLNNKLASSYRVVHSDQLNCSGDFVEAYAFALLAVKSVLGEALSFPSTTRVRKPVSGGVLAYPNF